MGAGTFKTRWREGFIRWERAWWCPAHKTYWYDDGVCRVCGARASLSLSQKMQFQMMIRRSEKEDA